MLRLLLGVLLLPVGAAPGTEQAPESAGAIVKDVRTEFLSLRARFLGGKVAARADARGLRIRLERLKQPPPGLEKAVAFQEEAAAAFNALRTGLSRVSRGGPTQEVRDLARLFALEETEVRRVQDLYAALCWRLPGAGVSYDEESAAFLKWGKPADDAALLGALDTGQAPAGPRALDAAGLEKAAAPLAAAVGSPLDAESLARLMDGASARGGTAHGGAAELRAAPSSKSEPNEAPAAAPKERPAGQTRADELDVNDTGADAPDDESGFRRALLAALPSLGALASRFEPAAGAAGRGAARARAEALCGALGTEPGRRVRFEDGSSALVGADGFLSYEASGGDAGWREGDGSAGTEVEGHRPILRWREDAGVGVSGSFRGTSFAAPPGTKLALSPDRSVLLLFAESPDGVRRQVGLVAAGLEKRCLDPLCAESLNVTESPDGTTRSLSLDLARLKDPSGLDPRGLPAAPAREQSLEAYGRLLTVLPKLIPGLDPAVSARRVTLIDGALHLSLRLPSGEASLFLEYDAPRVSARYERGSERMMLRCDEAVATACHRFVLDAQAAEEKGRARWVPSRSWRRSEEARGSGWAAGPPEASAVRDWSAADEGWAAFDGALATVGQLTSPAAAVVQTVYHLGSGAAYAAAAALTGSDAAETGWQRMMAAYSVAGAPLVSGARRATAALGLAEADDPSFRYRAALSGLGKEERSEVERILDAIVAKDARRRRDLGQPEPPAEVARAYAAAETFGQGNSARLLLETGAGYEKALGMAMLAGETYAVGRYSGMLSQAVWTKAAGRAAGAAASAEAAQVDRLAQTRAAWDAIDDGLGAAGSASSLARGTADFVAAAMEGDHDAAGAAFGEAAQGLIGTGFFLKGRWDARRPATEETPREPSPNSLRARLGPRAAARPKAAASDPWVVDVRRTAKALLSDPAVLAPIAKVLANRMRAVETDPLPDMAAVERRLRERFNEILDKGQVRLPGPQDPALSDDHIAAFDPQTGAILLNPTHAGDPESATAVLLHEMIHALPYDAGEVLAHASEFAFMRSAMGSKTVRRSTKAAWRKEIGDGSYPGKNMVKRYFVDENPATGLPAQTPHSPDDWRMYLRWFAPGHSGAPSYGDLKQDLDIQWLANRFDRHLSRGGDFSIAGFKRILRKSRMTRERASRVPDATVEAFWDLVQDNLSGPGSPAEAVARLKTRIDADMKAHLGPLRDANRALYGPPAPQP